MKTSAICRRRRVYRHKSGTSREVLPCRTANHGPFMAPWAGVLMSRKHGAADGVTPPELLRISSRPAVERGVSSLAIIREGQTLLFDCGEGTQRQMMRFGISFAFEEVFFTHMHSDHLLGITGLIRTMALQGRVEPLRAWVPRGGARTLRQCINLGGERTTFPIDITEIDAGATLARGDYRIEAFPVDHAGSSSLGYALVEEDRLGRFNPELARELGIPEGPLWGRIHKGQAVTLDDGRVIQPSVLVGGARRGRRIVLTGDTRPCQATIDAARDADVLIHEATFADEEAARALETGHSTAREAAQVARDAGVRRLVLTHISARYSRDARELELEAKQLFAATSIAKDGTEIELGLTEELADATAAVG
jgi:ribonuclease Z